jgi:hypothetical protein
MHRDGTHSSKIICASCPPQQATIVQIMAGVLADGWTPAGDRAPAGVQRAIASMIEREADATCPRTGRSATACSPADHSACPDLRPAGSVTMPAWQARAEQSHRDQVARDRAAQDRFYAGPMAAQYRG